MARTKYRDPSALPPDPKIGTLCLTKTGLIVAIEERAGTNKQNQTLYRLRHFAHEAKGGHVMQEQVTNERYSIDQLHRFGLRLKDKKEYGCPKKRTSHGK